MFITNFGWKIFWLKRKCYSKICVPQRNVGPNDFWSEITFQGENGPKKILDQKNLTLYFFTKTLSLSEV